MQCFFWRPKINTCDHFVVWESVIKLKYEDFERDQDESFLVYNHPANAAAATKIDICFYGDSHGNMHYSVINKFVKNESWMLVRSKHVLEHEQIHFDISEIYARKIRKALRQLIKENETDVNIHKDKIQKILKERTNYQKAYDRETYHGVLEKKQKTWALKIKSELSALSSYKDNYDQCTCKVE